MMIQLAAGWNYVTYTGPDDVASNVFADIYPYILTMSWVDENGYLWPIFGTTLMTAGVNCAIEVSQACSLENFEWTVSPPPDVLEFTCPVGIELIDMPFPVPDIWYALCGPIYLKIKSNFTHAKYMLFYIRAAAKLNGEFALGTYIPGHFKVCAEGFIGCLPGEGIAVVWPGEEVIKSQWDYEPAAPYPDLRLSVITVRPTHLCLQVFASDAFVGPYVSVLEQYFEIEEEEVTYAFTVGSPGVSAA